MHKISISFRRTDDRGSFLEYINNTVGWKSINGGQMTKGALMGNHYHKECETFFFLLTGSARVGARDVRTENAAEHLDLQSGEGAVFAPYETHYFNYLEDSEFLLLKSETYNPQAADTYEAMVDVT